MTKTRQGFRPIWWFCLILLILFSVVWGIFAIGNFQLASGFVNSFIPDGRLDSFSEEVFAAALIPFRAAFLLSFGLLLSLLVFPQKSNALLSGLLQRKLLFFREFIVDAKQFFSRVGAFLRHHPDRGILLLFMLLGGLLRFIMADKPMGHDEAYTYVAFASRDLIYVLGDYHLPNNHILHSIFVFLTTRLLGPEPWAVRLASITAAIFLIPASYLAGRAYFNRKAGLVLAGITSFFPSFLLVSTSARGYTLLSLFSVLIWWLAIRLKQRKNWFEWFLFVIFSALGFYTIPTMLYPFTAIMVWLFASWLLKDVSPDYSGKSFFWCVITAGLAVVALTMLLYLPVFYVTGARALLENSIVSGMQSDTLKLFFGNFVNRGSRAWQQWHEQFSVFYQYVSLLGFSLAIALHKKVSQQRLNFIVLAFIVIFSMIAAQKTMAWVRVWFFCAPFYFAWAAAGWVWLIGQLKGLNARSQHFLALFSVAVIALNAALWLFNGSSETKELLGKPSSLELASGYAAEHLEENECILVSVNDSSMVWYYTGLKGVDIQRFKPEDQEFNSCLLLLNSDEAALEQLLEGSALGLEAVQTDTIEQINSIGDYQIYRMLLKPRQ